MRLQNVARKNTGDIALLVQSHVQQKAGTNTQSDVTQFLPKFITFGNSKRRFRVSDVFLTVIAHHSLEAGATWHDTFDPAAEAGEEMGFDKACDNPDIRFHYMAIDH